MLVEPFRLEVEQTEEGISLHLDTCIKELVEEYQNIRVRCCGGGPGHRAGPGRVGQGPGLTGFLLLMSLEKYTGLLDSLCMGTREQNRRDLSWQHRHF